MVKFIESEAEWKKIMELPKELLVVVGFTASWSGPCRMINSQLEAMSKECCTALLVNLDVDDMSTRDIAERCGIEAMPTFQFYRGGEKIDDFVGGDAEGLKAKIMKLATPNRQSTIIIPRMVEYIESEEGWTDIMEQSKDQLVVVNFSASWWGPCQLIKTDFEAMPKEYPTAHFASVDVDAMEAIADRCGVDAAPTFQFFKNGKKVDQFVGGNIEGLKAKVAELAGYKVQKQIIKRLDSVSSVESKPVEPVVESKLVKPVQSMSVKSIKIEPAVKSIESKQEWVELIKQSKDKMVVVDFCASWSGPCQMMKPQFEAISKEHSNAIFVTVDVDTMDSVATTCGVQALPTFQFFKNGEKVDDFVGGNIVGLKNKLAELTATRRNLLKRSSGFRFLGGTQVSVAPVN